MKTALVFGHTSGLGLAVTHALTRSGWAVVGVARRELTLDGVTNIVADLAEREQREQAVATIRESHRDFDALIYAIDALDARELERSFQVNVFAPMTIESSLFDLVKANEADIINVTSSALVDYYPKYAEYSSSKAALRKFTRDLKHELKTTACRVTDFCPSGFSSDIYKTMSGDVVVRDESLQMRAEDLADLMVYTLMLPKRIEVSEIYLDRKNGQ
jgi:uncharacterized oxidoreductase